MTREQLIKNWDVIQAFKDGKQIQYKTRNEDWFIAVEPTFDLDLEYRVKPTPTKRLPTIEEVEKWFLENIPFTFKISGCSQRIFSFTKEPIDKSDGCVFIGLQWFSIEEFCNTYNHYDGTELYITENE